MAALMAAVLVGGPSARAQVATNCYSGGPGASYALETLAGDVHLGGPQVALSSDADLSLTLGYAPVAIRPLTITDDPAAPGITTNAAIAVRIPSSFVMTWDETNCAPVFAGTAAGKAGAASYSNSNQRLLIAVTADFSAGDTLIVSGLAFKNHLASGSAHLELDYDDDGLADAVDDKTITILGIYSGGPGTSYVLNQVMTDRYLNPVGSLLAVY